MDGRKTEHTPSGSPKQDVEDWREPPQRPRPRAAAFVAVLAAIILFSSADDAGLIFVNKTPWPVHIVAGSGRVEVCDIDPFEEAEAAGPLSGDESYYPLFDVSLSGTVTIKNLRSADRDFYFQIDGSRSNRRIEITAPESFNEPRTYIIVTNGSKAGGISLSRNDSPARMTTEETKNTVNAGETAVYGLNPTEINSFTVQPRNISSGPVGFRRGFVYHFLFDGASISTLDIRPLSRVGEKGWVRTIAETDTALQIVRNTDADIMAFASSTESGLVLYTATSGGETRALSRIKLPNFSITQALKTGGSFSTVSGYIQKDALYIPVLQKLDENGLAAAGLPPSGQSDRRSAYFLTLAEDGGGTLLAAGGADSGVNSAASYQAYIRALRKDGFTSLWELGPAEFDAAVSGAVKCGEVSAAAFDEARGVWVITGKNIEFDRLRNPVTGSYIARIDPGGNILGIDTSYKGLVFNKLLIDDEGGCYLAGEEETPRASYAVTLKLSMNGTELWRSRNRPGADSFYQDGLLDDENRQLVLAGTMLAGDLTGTGGTPFIEGINAATGETIWQEALTDSRFGGTALVTGIEKAPFYGFVLALSGIKDAYFAPPFMLARLNARGKF